MEKKAFITGISGQDGSYLAELLLSKGYKVFGLKRRTSTHTTERIDHLNGQIEIIDGDMLDTPSLFKAIKQAKPDEVYNLAAQSFVASSFVQPELTGEITGIGTTRLLEAVRAFCPSSKFYQASTSEMFGKIPPPHNEETIFHPMSPYAAAKLYAHWMARNYREAYNMFICTGILFNHESVRRGQEFVTQRVAQGVAAIKHGKVNSLKLGNLEAKRDWGHAKDFVEAMWLMLQHDTPDDYVIATGESHSVRDLVEFAFGRAGLDWEKHVEVDQNNFRPTEVDWLQGDSSKAQKVLGWKPKIKFKELIEEMVDYAIDHPEEWLKN
jgi:GDPmannose 4,6-dehydratase